MSAWPVRFIHASDFHLEQPLYGVAEVPDHLRELFSEAPSRAAVGVFDAAIAEGVDFVVLVGDIVQTAYAGPRAITLLAEQFQRLAEHEIAVYWLAGRTDAPQSWPRSLPLPKNVHRFAPDVSEEVTHERAGTAVARILSVAEDRRGRLLIADLKPLEGVFSIGLAHGSIEEAALKKQRVEYLALGGKHQRRTLAGAPRMAHYCGTHQGRSPLEAGPHGCTLVEVDDSGRVRSRLVPVDCVRWSNQRVEIDEQNDRKQLEELLREQMQTLIAGAGERDMLISWTIVGNGPLSNQLRRGGLAEEMLEWLQTEFGTASPAAWSFSLKASSPAELPAAWYQEDTILGDFLRLVEQYERDPDLPIDLEPYLSERHLAGSIAAAVRLDETERRRHVLREVAQLGGELLGGNGFYASSPQETSS